RERDVFAESLRRRAGAPRWSFYEGPPTANGPPGAHHVIARVFKDVYPRYKTMSGYLVERKGGWDCHGLPVEIAVERELGITEKDEIEAFGIAEFNNRCRESVFEFLAEWNRSTERIGFWLDLEHAYRTLDPDYIESVWWALEQIYAKGLLYEGHKVVPYCPRCGTALSSHEVALGYEDVVDRTVYVKLQLLGSEDKLVVWTTTPWTLPGNVAAAVGLDIQYVRVRVGDEVLVVAEARAEALFGAGVEVLERLHGAELVGRRYHGPIFAASDREAGGLPVIGGDFVTTADGTGIVHIAPAFGQDDYDAARAADLLDPMNPQSVYNPVKADGTYDERVSGYEGRHVKDPQLAADLTGELRERGLLLREEDYEHSYPHCWRCGTPLIYYAKRSWYIATSRLRDRMLAANETVNWHPAHIKHGRFGDWLANNVDWALSRERYWGTPLPIWRCGNGHLACIGSFAELERRSGETLLDPHRPYVDDLSFPCEECGEEMRRVPEVIDVWFDSGSMPFAQHHAPFENEGRFEQSFPADFICEALDQTRGWFYSLLAISTLLRDEAPYRNVVCLGLLLDAEGQKMSKSRGNVVAPDEIIDRYGADAWRWYFLASKQPWDSTKFSPEAVGEVVRLFLRQLWSVYGFFVLYANAAEGAGAGVGGDGALDSWLASRVEATTQAVRDGLDGYDATSAGRAISELVEDLSNWYVRRSRRRFWDGEASALETLRSALVTIAQLLAPFTPFVADELYESLDGSLPSVHLCDFPVAGARDVELEAAMATVRETVRLGLAARAAGKVKLRQPLREAIVVASGRERAAIERLAELVRDELNVRELRFVAAADELASYTVKPNFRSLGPRFGKQMGAVEAAVAALDPAHVASKLRDGGEIAISIAGRDHILRSEDVIISLAPLEGYGLEREGSHAVALELTLDDDLVREGRAREIVHAVQGARRDAGLEISDRIALDLDGEGELVDAARAHEGYITGETLATSITYGERQLANLAQVTIDGGTLQISLERAPQEP
ncbi:MAG TPA: isoleucine--tRNA ligase, partial [Solirubrobacteraceae bacterium]|nr:isoleucine--tRNA ligase [Solirubrobacteraceae bacterium]